MLKGKINTRKRLTDRLFSFVAYNVYVLCLICMGGRKRKKTFSSFQEPKNITEHAYYMSIAALISVTVSGLLQVLIFLNIVTSQMLVSWFQDSLQILF